MSNEKNKDDELLEKYKQLAENREDYIDPSNFVLPDINEMVAEDLMSEIYQQYEDGDIDKDYESKEIINKAFYYEEPYTTAPGYYAEDGVFLLRVNKWKKGSDYNYLYALNKWDGDTVDFNISDLDCGNDPIIMSKHNDTSLTYANFEEYYRKMNGSDNVQIRFVGIDAMEIPHFEVQPIRKDAKDKRVIEITYKEMLNMKNKKHNIIYEKCPYIKSQATVHQYKDDEKMKLLLISDENGIKTYSQIIDRFNGEALYIQSVKASTGKEPTISKDYDYYVIIGQEESEPNKIEDGYKAQALVRKMMDNASEIMLMLDANSLSVDRQITTYSKTFNSVYYLDDIIKYMKDQWDVYYKDLKQTTYSYLPYGMDTYKRSLGVIYVEYEGEWINLNKYVLANTKMTLANPSFDSSPELQQLSSGLSSTFKLWSYNKNNIEWVDSFDKIASKSYEDRIELHRKATGIDFTQYRECTLFIGDTLMLIPPTNIRNISQLSYERIPNMRSKGTMAKNKGNVDHMLELTLYFYEDAGINGISYEYTTPSGELLTYKLDGLRSLLAQFKIAPFLPIENGYINDVLGIEAVALQNLNISNVDGIPRLLKVILTLREFNYRLYMPDMPIADNDNEGSVAKMQPLFAKAFNWELFRYYYQRAIMAGDNLALIEESKGFTDYSYNLKYYSNKNAVGPWMFCGPLSAIGNISFYIPDENWLNQALQVKKDRDSYILSNLANVELSDRAKSYMSVLSKLADDLKDLRTNHNCPEFYNALDELFSKVKNKEIEVYLSVSSLSNKQLKDEGITTSNIDNTTSLGSLVLIKNTKKNNDLRQYFLLKIKDALVNKFNDVSYFKSMSIDETIKKDTNDIYTAIWTFNIHLNRESITDEDWANIKEVLDTSDALNTSNVFKNDTIKFSYQMSFPDKKLLISDTKEDYYVNTFIPVTTDDEEKLSALQSYLENSDTDNVDMTDGTINDYNQEIDFYVKDYKNPANMPFVPYIEEVMCTAFSGNTANNFTDIYIKAIEGKAPQYMGGQDIQLEFQLITDDLTIVGALNNLPTLASAMAKKYRRILPAWPIKIRSDLTRILGVCEVLIDAIEIDTLEGYPGVYTISMRLTSVDRTQRQREALRRLDVAPNGGKITYGAGSKLSIKSYFAIESVLSQAELYPDLDIPSLDELAEKGFRFIKYSGKNRSYPDPDFYIIYNYPYTSLIIKKMVKDTLSKNLLNTEGDENTQSYNFTDIMGAKVTTKISALVGLTHVSDDNKQAKTYSDTLDDLEKSIRENLSNNTYLDQYQTEDVINKAQMIATVNRLILAEVNEGWEVSPSWKAPLAGSNIDESIKESTKTNPNIFADEIKKMRIKAINLIDNILSKPIKYRENKLKDYFKKSYEGGAAVSTIITPYYKAICEEAIGTIFGSDDGQELLKLLCHGEIDWTDLTDTEDPLIATKNTGKFNKKYFKSPKLPNYLVGFLFACGCALSADKEYATKIDKKDWYPNHFVSINGSTIDISDTKYNGCVLPYCITEKIGGSPRVATTVKDAINNGVIYGAWRISKYNDPQTIVNMVERDKSSSIEYTKNNDSVYTSVNAGFIDPYYNKASKETQKKYQKSIATNITSNAEAFTRQVLLMLRKLICEGLFFSEIDVLVTDYVDLYNAETTYDTTVSNALTDLGLSEATISSIMEAAKDSFDKSFCVRLIYPFIMALTECNNDIYRMIKNRDYNSLNALTGYVENGAGTTESRTRIVKFLAALSGIGLSLDSTNKKEATSVSQKIMNTLIKDVYIEAANDPRSYLVHSFYDMVVNDKRGRLVRAFPTYYVIFIDEGRKLGTWKLHDNFYNMNSISSINVVKSRKIATDTCNIVMNNTFNSYTMEPDSTTTQQYTDIYGLKDVFDSIFSPKAYFDKEKAIRLRKNTPDTVVLQPGIRIHVRMGYSADGSKLPIVFNGKVAEINVEEVAEIIAQGDGHELMNPLNAFGEIEATDLDVVQSTVTWFKDIRGAWSGGGQTPRDLLSKILTAKYGGAKKVVDKVTDGRWFNENPFGIIHFGDPKFTDIFERGEVTQNLYEVADETLLKGVNELSSDRVNSCKITPTINVAIQDKTFWDLLHLCANSGENYIGAIRDFGFRSTVFLGRPNDYYAYAYELVDGKIVEKRKPFQQFHYYDSYTDIIYNSIKASENQIKTNAIGMWQASSKLWGRENATVGPIYLDMNIYPEYQKSMTVNTGLLGAGNGRIDVGLFTHFGEKLSTNANDDKVNKALVRRVTINTLRDSVKDMYQGDLCILGDPSIKPYDRVYIHDTYEDMMGMFEVEAVIHNMSSETGFTTSIMPDVIARHQDSYEIATQSLLGTVASVLTLGVAVPILDKLWGAAVHGKLVTLIAKSEKVFGATRKLSDIANNLYSATGMKDFLTDHPTAKAVFSKFNVLPSIDQSHLQRMANSFDYLSSVTKANLVDSNGKILYNKFDDIAKALSNFNEIDMDKYEELLKTAYNSNYGATKATYSLNNLENSIATAKDSYKQLTDLIDVSNFDAKGLASDISKIKVDNITLNNATSKEVSKILDNWTKGQVSTDKAELIDQISKVLSDDEVAKALKEGKLSTNKADDFIKSFSTLFDDIDDNGKTVTRFANALNSLKCGDKLDDLVSVFKGALRSNVIGLLIDIAIETMITIFVRNTKALFTDFLQDIQAIDVYPIYKYNKPLIAGMNGHKGSVYGWPVKEGYDSIQGMVIEFTDWFKKIDGNAPIADWILGLFVDNNILSQLTEEWKDKLNIETSDNLTQEELTQQTYGDISAAYSATNNVGYSYMTIPRISKTQLDDANSATLVKQYQIKASTMSAIGLNDKVLALTSLNRSSILKKASINKRFSTAHAEKYDAIVNVQFESGVEAIPVKIGNNTNVYDMPLVQEELVYLLEQIISDDALSKAKLQLTSGVRINDNKGWNSTGYVMTIKMLKGSMDDLKSVLDKLKDKTNIINTDGFFDYSLNNKKAVIIVYPRQIISD